MRFLPALLVVGALSISTTAVPAADDAAASPTLGNPQMALILSGLYYGDDTHGDGPALLAGVAGALPDPGVDGPAEGFNLGESELGIFSTVDPYLDAYANISFSADAVGVEEAAFVTRALPAGWQLRGGKFLSGFGYQNGKHAHAWDFTDQNLAYSALVGGEGLKDTGLQVTWLPPLDTYLQLGAEVLQGDQEKFGAATDLQEVADTLAVPLAALPPLDRHGPQLFIAFAKVAPDIGAANALQLGVSYATHRSQQEVQASGSDLLYADGDAGLLGLEAIWKRTATGNYGVGSARVQAEYLRLEKNLDIVFDTVAADVGKTVTGTQDGFYIQGVYGFAPRWEGGLRYDATGMTNDVATAGTTAGLGNSSRLSAEFPFRPSEFSYLRLQFSEASVVDASGTQNDFSQLMIQYNLSLGAHGAHAF